LPEPRGVPMEAWVGELKCRPLAQEVVEHAH
jgi:hypothetical protein